MPLYYQRRCKKPEDQFKALLAEVKKVAGFRTMAQECARDAAPYLHHKLASIEASIDHSGDVTLRHEDAVAILEREEREQSGG